MLAPFSGCKADFDFQGCFLLQIVRITVADFPFHICSDSIAAISKISTAVADVPCSNILGLVIYDLPGRDCAAKASNGELAAGDIATYQSKYIDPIVAILKNNTKTAFALIIEPDSLPNLVTNANLTTCQNSASGYRTGVAYAIKNLNLPNVVMYLDAGHGGWLGCTFICCLYKAAPPFCCCPV